MRMKIGNLLSGHHCYYCYYHYIVFGGSVARVEVVVQDRLVALPYRSTVHGILPVTTTIRPLPFSSALMILCQSPRSPKFYLSPPHLRGIVYAMVDPESKKLRVKTLDKKVIL